MARKISRELLAKVLGNNHEAIKYFEGLGNTGIDLEETVQKIQEELDRVEAGAGLETDGSYIQPVGTNFINSSTSLANADLLLDSAIASVSGESILTITNDLSATNINQMILANALSNVINVTLPNPVNFFTNGVSKKIGITKIDATRNFINILPNGTELIVGETQQRLRYEGEVLNFITDGTNWYLGA